LQSIFKLYNNLNTNKLHILAIATHPDDLELGCAGTLIKHVQAGQTVGIIDLTEGELGTRGNVALRYEEARKAADVMGIKVRENAQMADGFFKNDKEHQLKLITYIRHYQPDIVIANALTDRHPDHGKGGRLIADACFLSGLAKIETERNGAAQQPWRPKRVFHMIQDRLMEPSFLVDISDTFDKKMESVRCYGSQFHNPGSDEPATYIATGQFLRDLESRDALMGKRIGTKYAEGYVSENIPGISSLDALILPELP
jgi:N-acetylglucosamine malate deacetylase 1